MTYELKFHPQALNEWEKLDNSIQKIFKKKLEEVLETPVRPRQKLSGLENCYKIKQSNSGFRLVYSVDEEIVTVIVLSVGKRERKKIYDAAMKRFQRDHP